MKSIRFLNIHIFALCFWGLSFLANDQMGLVEHDSSAIFGLGASQPTIESGQPAAAPENKMAEKPGQALARLGVATTAPAQAEATQATPASQGVVSLDLSKQEAKEAPKVALNQGPRVPRLRRKSQQMVNVRLNREREVPRRGATSVDKKRNMSELEQIKLENSRLEREIQLMLAGEFGPESAIEDHELFKFVFPSFARPIDKDGYTMGKLTFSNADWGYNDAKRVVSLGEMVYGTNVTVQDLSLIAKLARLSSMQSGTTWGAASANGTADATAKKYLFGDTSLGATAVGLEQSFFETDGTIVTALPPALNKKITNALQIKIWDHYLNRLADQLLQFKANTKQLGFSVSFSKNFLSNLYSLVFTVPVVFRSNKVEMVTELSAAKSGELNAIAAPDTATQIVTSDFFAKYPGGLRDFFKDFLQAQNIDQDPRSSQFGVGDISLHINRKMNVRELDLRGVVGFGVTAPTSVKVNNKQIWPALLGNGGFWEISAHIAGYTSLSGFANPHFFAQIQFPIPAKVEMRTAKIATRQGSPFYTTDNERASNFAFGNEFVFSSQYNWSLPETKIPLFARQPLQTIDVNKGVVITCEFGTLLKDVVSKDFSIDLAYRFMFKGQDSAGFRSRDARYDVASVFENTTQEMHKVSATLCYRYKKDLQFEANFGHVIFGRNVPRALELGFSGHMSF